MKKLLGIAFFGMMAAACGSGTQATKPEPAATTQAPADPNAAPAAPAGDATQAPAAPAQQ